MLLARSIYTFGVVKNVRVIFRAVFWFLRPFPSVSILPGISLVIVILHRQRAFHVPCRVSAFFSAGEMAMR